MTPRPTRARLPAPSSNIEKWIQYFPQYDIAVALHGEPRNNELPRRKHEREKEQTITLQPSLQFA
jgi:hypothetical protein